MTNLIIPCLTEERFVGPFDVTIVNNQETTPWVKTSSRQMGRKIYFLQDYETYILGDSADRDEVRRTLHIDWPIVYSSLAGARLLESLAGRECQVIRNAVDTSLFRKVIPIESKERMLIGFPARIERTKRAHDAVRAAEIVRALLSSHIRFWCFGHDLIPGLPTWINHHAAPTDTELVDLYNRSKLFFVPSEHEGFGRPGAESMACGAVLISTTNGGVETYATNEYSVILCRSCDPALMATAINRLISNEKLLCRIAQRGTESCIRS